MHKNTDFKAFYGWGGFNLFQIDGKYYRAHFDMVDNSYEIRYGDSMERFFIMKPMTFDFNATYRGNNNDSIVLTKEGRLTYENVDYQVMLIDNSYYAVKGRIFKRIAMVDKNRFQFVSDALYTTSDLIEATIDEVLGDLKRILVINLCFLAIA